MKSFSLENEFLIVKGIDYGATLTTIIMKDERQERQNLLLTFTHEEDYVNKNNIAYINAVVGPLAGRVTNGRYLDQQLTINQAPHHLHGGYAGFSFQTFQIEMQTPTKIVLRHQHIKGIDNYPSAYDVQVCYELKGNVLNTTFHVICNPKGPINMTSHLYFNLNGDALGNVLGHRLELKSDQFYEVSEDMRVSGEKKNTDNSCFDFNQSKMIGNHDCPRDKSFDYTKGFDHPFILTSPTIVLKEPHTKRRLTMHTNQPVVVVYTSNFLDSRLDLNGKVGRPHLGICLEPQEVPNHVNIKENMDEQTYYWETSYCFDIDNEIAN